MKEPYKGEDRDWFRFANGETMKINVVLAIRIGAGVYEGPGPTEDQALEDVVTKMRRHCGTNVPIVPCLPVGRPEQPAHGFAVAVLLQSSWVLENEPDRDGSHALYAWIADSAEVRIVDLRDRLEEYPWFRHALNFGI